jgi:SAM-dependent methyltransferase
MNKMDTSDLKRVNELWINIYPYLAEQAMEYYGRKSGDVLDFGPFAGGIADELKAKYPRLNVNADAGLKLDTNKKYDLVILRGAFFFIFDDKKLLRQIFEALKEGGTAFVGGGFGKGIPQEKIDEIAGESRILNDRLGRRRIAIAELKELVEQSELTVNSRIVEEGGVWIVLKK